MFCSIHLGGVWTGDSGLGVNYPYLAKFDFVWAFWNFNGDFSYFVDDFLESVVDEFVVAVKVLAN